MLKKIFEQKERYFFAIFLIGAFTIYLSYSLCIPYGSAPDESMRYQVPEFIFKNGYLPRGDEPSIINPVWGISYAFTPITTYIIQAFFMKITSFFTMEHQALVMSARLVNVVISTLTLWVCILIAQRIFRNKYTIKWLFLCLVAFLPQYAFISAYINMDVLAIFSSAVIVYSWIIGIQSDWDYKSCIILALGLSLCLLSYYNAYGFILCSVALYFCSILFASQRNIKENKVIQKTIIIAGIVLALSAWWFIRNYILYDGDFLGISASNKCAELYANEWHKPDSLDIPAQRGQSLWFMLKTRSWLVLVARSFIGMFGHCNIPLPIKIYFFYASVFVMAIVGCIIGFRKFFPKLQDKKDFTSKKTVIFNIVMFFAMIIPFLISMYYSYTADFQPQGRYSLPCIIPLMYFISIGFNNHISSRISKRAKNIIVAVAAIFTVIFVIDSLTGVIIPIYQGVS